MTRRWKATREREREKAQPRSFFFVCRWTPGAIWRKRTKPEWNPRNSFLLSVARMCPAVKIARTNFLGADREKWRHLGEFSSFLCSLRNFVSVISPCSRSNDMMEFFHHDDFFFFTARVTRFYSSSFLLFQCYLPLFIRKKLNGDSLEGLLRELETLSSEIFQVLSRNVLHKWSEFVLVISSGLEWSGYLEG